MSLLHFVQVAADREAMIVRIEAMALKFRKNGECAKWLEGVDPEIKEVEVFRCKCCSMCACIALPRSPRA